MQILSSMAGATEGLRESLFKVAMRDLGEVLGFVLNGVPYSSSRLELFEEPCRKLHMIM